MLSLRGEAVNQPQVAGPASLLLPGDEVVEAAHNSERRGLGRGIIAGPTGLTASQPGLPLQRDSGRLSIDCHRRHYFVRPGDQVVGVVEDRGGEHYRVNVFSGSPALLGRTSFDGATKRNRPDLRKGDVVYCKVSFAEPGMDTELTCESAAGVRKDWSSGEAVRASRTNCRRDNDPAGLRRATRGRAGQSPHLRLQSPAAAR